MNNTVRKHPRTLEEAFGPGERGGIYEREEPMSLEDKVIVIVGACIMLAMLAGLLR